MSSQKTGPDADSPARESTDLGTKQGATEALRAQSHSGRLGGARADFVAGLGRKVADCTVILKSLEKDLGSREKRDDLRRKLHALGAGARLLRFEALANALAEAEAVLERAGQAGKATAADVDRLTRLFDDLPSLAWADPATRMQTPSDPPRTTPHTALVIGEDDLAAALSEASQTGAQFDCERSGDEQVAFELAKSITPEIIILDGDLPSATELVEALNDDPVTESIPIVVVVSDKNESATRFVAQGVARVVKKPFGSSTLHVTCTEIVEQRSTRHAGRMALGTLSVQDLAARLGKELERALLSGVDERGRAARVPLGEGTEVIGAMWGAIARIREVIAARSDGNVQFSPTGPEGAITLAPWLHPDVPASERSPRSRGAALDVTLAGRKVVVADDDPGVTWFISDLLRTNGCIVHEALDGQTALDLAYRLSPDLVVSDILMPALDGFALTRAMKRDVALRDVPVILLSWKEDLLQRVRELGVSAAAYLRKESDARAIVARVREALWPKGRVEARLRAGGEVRGRLDGLTVRSLLELVCSLRPESRVSVRDAVYLYEMEIRGGAPRRVTRTGGDGSFERGERVLAAMLGASAGWFVVAPAEGEAIVQGELHGSLAGVLARPIANARGAAQALCGARTIGVERVKLDLEMMDGYLRVTPQPARSLIERIAQGESPREMLLTGEIDPWLVEDVLVDLSVRGAVRAVRGSMGEDLLGPAVEAAHGVLQGLPRRSVAPRSPSVGPRASNAPLKSEQVAKELGKKKLIDDDDALPSSLADAVMRELREPSSKPPPIVMPGDLKPRPSSNTPGASADSPAAVPTEELSSRHLVAAVASETEIETVYEARILTPSSPSSEAVNAEPEHSVSMPLPLVRRTSRPPPPPPSSDDGSKKP